MPLHYWQHCGRKHHSLEFDLPPLELIYQSCCKRKTQNIIEDTSPHSSSPVFSAATGASPHTPSTSKTASAHRQSDCYTQQHTTLTPAACAPTIAHYIILYAMCCVLGLRGVTTVLPLAVTLLWLILFTLILKLVTHKRVQIPYCHILAQAT